MRSQGLLSLPGLGGRAFARPSAKVSHVRSRGPSHLVFCTGGGFHVPSRIEGGVSFGQQSRSMGMNLPLCVVSSQLASLAVPGELA